LVFTANSLNGLDQYIDDSNYTIIEHEKLDPSYSYTLVNGEIVRGEKWPVPPPIS
jgi:uncharacterized protein YuzB (UPF0349 family)